MPVPLVTVEDIEAALGRPLTDSESARATFIADKLAEAFRQRARQTFTVEAARTTVPRSCSLVAFE